MSGVKKNIAAKRIFFIQLASGSFLHPSQNEAELRVLSVPEICEKNVARRETDLELTCREWGELEWGFLEVIETTFSRVLPINSPIP